MWRPSPEFRLPTWLSLAIAVGLGSVGIWCARKGLAGWDGSSGFDRLAGAVLLLFAGGAFLLTTFALMFARSSSVFWIGVIALFVVLAMTTRPSHQRTSQGPDANCERGSSGTSCRTGNVSARTPAPVTGSRT